MSSRPVSTASTRSGPLRSLLQGWYRLVAPPDVDPSASLDEREVVRRGKLGSFALLISFLDTLIALPLSFSLPTPELRIILFILTGLGLWAFVLNRTRHIVLAGIICVVGTELGLLGTVLSDPHGFTLSAMEDYFLLVQAVLFAATLLPPFCVFIVAVGNCIAFNVIFAIMPHAPEVTRLVAFEGTAFIQRNMTLQLVVAILVYLWITSMRNALVRADRSESLAGYQKNFSDRKRLENEQLQQAINALVVDITNVERQPDMHLDIDPSNPFWQLYQALENMRKRFVNLKASQAQLRAMLEAYNSALTQLSTFIRRQDMSWQRTGVSVIDTIAMNLEHERRLKANVLLHSATHDKE